MSVSIFGHVITNLILFHDTRVGLAKSSSSFFTTSPKHTPSAENICKHGSVLLQTNTLSLPSDVTSPASIFCTTYVSTHHQRAILITVTSYFTQIDRKYLMGLTRCHLFRRVSICSKDARNVLLQLENLWK